jgi:hypothetical protein
LWRWGGILRILNNGNFSTELNVMQKEKNENDYLLHVPLSRCVAELEGHVCNKTLGSRNKKAELGRCP